MLRQAACHQRNDDCIVAGQHEVDDDDCDQRRERLRGEVIQNHLHKRRRQARPCCRLAFGGNSGRKKNLYRAGKGLATTLPLPTEPGIDNPVLTTLAVRLLPFEETRAHYIDANATLSMGIVRLAAGTDSDHANTMPVL